MSEGRHWTSRALGNPRLFMAIGLIALVVFLFLFADTVEIGLVWAGIALGIFLFLWLCAFLWLSLIHI